MKQRTIDALRAMAERPGSGVPVTSPLGCHIGLVPFEGNEAETLYRGDIDWEEKEQQWRNELKAHGIDLDRYQPRRFTEARESEGTHDQSYLASQENHDR